MPGSAKAELIFIAAMMVLILVISFASVYFFFKTYKKEMAEKKAPVDKTSNETPTTVPVGEQNRNGAS